MGFLEAIGGLVLMIIGVAVFAGWNIRNDNIKKERKMLVEFNDACNDLIYRFNKSIRLGSPIMSNEELNKELDKIMKDSEQVRQARERFNDKLVSEEKKKQEYKNTLLLDRAMGIQYKLEVFEIFDLNIELLEEELFGRIKSKYGSHNHNQINELIKQWEYHKLIEKSFVSKKYWVVGKTLTTQNPILYEFWDKQYKSERDVWLLQENKTLLPNSKDFAILREQKLKDVDDSSLF